MNRRPKSIHLKIFIFWLFLLFLTVITFFLSSKGLFEEYHFYYEILCYTHVLNGPILFFYILSFIKEDLKFELKYLIHAIPIIIYFIYKTAIKALGLVHCLDSEGCFNSDNIYNVISVMMKLGILAAYVIASKLLINKIRNDRKLNESKKLSVYNWLNSIIQGVIILITIAWVIEALFFFEIPFAIGKKSLINIIVTLFILTFIYIWNRYSFILNAPLHSKLVKEKKYKDGLTEGILTENYIKLRAFLEKSQAFTDKDLTLKKLSELTGFSEHSISEIVNRKAEKSYSDYINSYRIDLFLEKLKVGEHKTNTLLGLAFDCGFNSKSTFNRAFKLHTNKTPSEYIKDLS